MAGQRAAELDEQIQRTDDLIDGVVYDLYGLTDEEIAIVELPTHVALFPVDEDPLEGLRAAVGDAFEETAADELKTDAREAVSRGMREATDRSQDEG